MKFNQIKTRYDLARLLELPQSYLTYVLYVADFDSFYNSFDISKKYGGVRKIFAPNSQLKVIQQRLAKQLCIYQAEKDSGLNISHAFQKIKTFFQMLEYIAIKNSY